MPSMWADQTERREMSPCSEDGWLEVALHYTGGRQEPKPSENEEEPALAQRFSGDSVEELTQMRRGGASKGGRPVKAATASLDGSSLRRCARGTRLCARCLQIDACKDLSPCVLDGLSEVLRALGASQVVPAHACSGQLRSALYVYHVPFNRPPFSKTIQHAADVQVHM